MCVKIETFYTSITGIASTATMVVYGILFGGMHPIMETRPPLPLLIMNST